MHEQDPLTTANDQINAFGNAKTLSCTVVKPLMIPCAAVFALIAHSARL